MTIHDHFEGSAHCVECQGRCTLAGEELAVTSIFRYLFEYLQIWEWHNSVPPLMARPLLELGVPVDRFVERARKMRSGKWE
jgi:hypothetical protein